MDGDARRSERPQMGQDAELGAHDHRAETRFSHTPADYRGLHACHVAWYPVGEYEVVGMLVNRDGSSQVIVRGALRVVPISQVWLLRPVTG